MRQIDRKLDSAQGKYQATFGTGTNLKSTKVAVKEFDMINEHEEILVEKREPRQLKTPSTSHVSHHAGAANLKDDEIFKEFTPQQFDSECPRLSNVGTDEHGNRSSIVPGSARPSSLQRQSSSVNSFNSKSSPVTRIPKVTASVKKSAPKVIQKPQSSVPQLRQNFVKMNTN